MRFIGDCTYGEGDGDGVGEGKVVVVGVKFDAESRELLTWALVKVAEPGDRIIALHVLDTITESTGSLLSLVKTFDSILAVYEGFCNLKQVDLKLKVCRGTSPKKVIVREAQSYGAAKVIVGISKTPHTIRSSTTVAKYCARKLPKKFCVFAVYNGKIVFQREATDYDTDNSPDDNRQKNIVRSLGTNVKVPIDENAVPGEEKSNKECHQCLRKSGSSQCLQKSGSSRCLRKSASSPYLQKSGSSFKRKSHKKNCTNCDSRTPLYEDSPEDKIVDSSLALVPVQSNQNHSDSNSVVVREMPRSKPGWPLLRQAFLSKQQHAEKPSAKKSSLIQWVLRLPSRYTSAVVYPDHKQNHSAKTIEDHHSNSDGESSPIVPVEHEAVFPLLSACDDLPRELEGLHDRYSSTCRLFSYQELFSVTSNFRPENMVGKGGHSHVYRGSLPDGKELAVKILKPSKDVLKEFVSEIEIITALNHKNIISLFGFCFEDNNLLLVYDFLSRGSLEENLHGNKKDGNTFGWKERYKVAVGVAEALDYLHNSCDQPVIHRDVKSSNILLSDDFEPQLSDFGLASWLSTSSSPLNYTDVAGTFGYLAPEYFMHGKVSDKIDVYAFGVVLLELLSGKKPISNENPKGQESLLMWAKPILKDGKVSLLLDPSLDSDFDSDLIERMVLAATLSIRRAPTVRPQMNLILKLLQGDEEAMNWAKQQVSASEDPDTFDDESTPLNFQSHLNLALLDVDDKSLSPSGSEKSVSIEDYLQGRWSCTSSFN